jgi:hypothetical protein
MTTTRINSLAFWLIAAALLLRALLPAGLMPQASPNSWTVVICSSNGTYTLVLDETGKPAPSDTASNGLCAFACALGQALLLASIILFAFGLFRLLPETPRRHIGHLAFRRWLPPQRGPPLVS